MEGRICAICIRCGVCNIRRRKEKTKDEEKPKKE